MKRLAAILMRTMMISFFLVLGFIFKASSQ